MIPLLLYTAYMQNSGKFLLIACLLFCFSTSFSQEYEAYYTDGNAKFLASDYNGAIASYTRYLALFPEGVNAYYSRAKAKAFSNDFEGSILDLDTFLLFTFDYADAWLLRGYAMQQLGNYQGSREYLSMAIALKPEQGDAYFYRGYAAYMTDDTTNTIADFTKALELGTTEAPMAYYCRGYTRGFVADYAGAIEDLTKAIEYNSAFADTWFYRCLAKLNTGDNAGSCADCAKALELGYPDAAEIINEYCK